MPSTNPLIREYERYRLRWMLENDIMLSDLRHALIELYDSLCQFNAIDEETLMTDLFAQLYQTGVNGKRPLLRADWLETAWRELSDVPVDDDGHIDETWRVYDKGTDREVIWHDFDEVYPGGIVALNPAWN